MPISLYHPVISIEPYKASSRLLSRRLYPGVNWPIRIILLTCDFNRAAHKIARRFLPSWYLHSGMNRPKIRQVVRIHPTRYEISLAEPKILRSKTLGESLTSPTRDFKHATHDS